MIRKVKSLIYLSLVVYCFSFMVSPVFGVVDQINFGGSQPAGINPQGNPRILDVILTNALVILFVVGGIAVIFMVAWGALAWILSGGDKEKVAAARSRITHGLIGLALLALTWLIISVVGKLVNFVPFDPRCLPILSAPFGALSTDLNNCL